VVMVRQGALVSAYALEVALSVTGELSVLNNINALLPYEMPL
jgi:hypothetical protein